VNNKESDLKRKKPDTGKKFSALAFKIYLILALIICAGVFIALGIVSLTTKSSIDDLSEDMSRDAIIESAREAKLYVNASATERASFLSMMGVSDAEDVADMIGAFNKDGIGFTFLIKVAEDGKNGEIVAGINEGSGYSASDFISFYKKSKTSTAFTPQTFNSYSNSVTKSKDSLCVGFAEIGDSGYLLVSAIPEDVAYASFRVSDTFETLIPKVIKGVNSTCVAVTVLFSLITIGLTIAAVLYYNSCVHKIILTPLFNLCFDVKKTVEDMEGVEIEIRKDTDDEVEIINDAFVKVAESLKTHIQDVMQLSGLTEKFENSANFDMLTGVFNRRRFFELVQPHAVIAAKKNAPTFVIMVDLDHFKRVNDTYGHAAGDEVLKTVAGKIKDAVRPSDLFGRYGGEEFVMFISVSDVANAKGFADRIRGIIESAPVRFEDIDIPVTASMGLAQAAPDISFEEALKYSDEALYRAKENGRNRVEIYTPENALSDEEKDLRDAAKEKKKQGQ